MGMTPAIDVLLDARALLARPDGWIKGTETSPREQGGWAYCLQGGIQATGGQHGAKWQARSRVESLLGLPIPTFNDHPNTGKADVLDAIDRAIFAEWNRYPMTPPRYPQALGPAEILKFVLEDEPFFDIA